MYAQTRVFIVSYYVFSSAGMNKQAVPKNVTEILNRENKTETLANASSRKNSMDLRMDDETATRKNSVAANANEGI